MSGCRVANQEALPLDRAALRVNPAYGTATVALARILHIEKGYEEESALQANLAHAGTGVDADVATVGGGREWRRVAAVRRRLGALADDSSSQR